MQRPQPANLDLVPRTTPSPPPLPSPPSSATKSPVEHHIMSPVQTRRWHYRKPSRHSVSSTVSETQHAVSEEDRMFVYEFDASEDKYMHHFDQLDGHLDVGPISSSDHKLRNHPSGEMKTWEYLLPERMWPPLPEKAKSVDAAIYIRWGRDIGYVQITNILKALMIPSVKMSEFLKGYEEHIVRIRGGQIGMQGSWIPYNIARQVCLAKCFKIREYLAPLFGPDFVKECVPNHPPNVQRKRALGRRPKSPTPVAVKRPSDELHDESDREYQRPRKRPILSSPCASGKLNPPALPTNLDLSFLGPIPTDEICSMLSTARELARMQYCAPTGVPKNDWPMPGDPRLGGYIYIHGRRFKWDGANNLKERPEAPVIPTTILSSKNQTPPHFSIPSQQQALRYPITPSPHQSPFAQPPLEWQSPYCVSSRSLISPPMSVRGSFSEPSRERQYSSNDECRTPIQEVYSGPLFPSPQPEN